jgi:hypothetical protein
MLVLIWNRRADTGTNRERTSVDCYLMTNVHYSLRTSRDLLQRVWGCAILIAIS